MARKRKRYPRLPFLMMKETDELFLMLDFYIGRIAVDDEPDKMLAIADLIVQEFLYREDDEPPRVH
jgi:hypothetical protein